MATQQATESVISQDQIQPGFRFMTEVGPREVLVVSGNLVTTDYGDWTIKAVMIYGTLIS